MEEGSPEAASGQTQAYGRRRKDWTICDAVAFMNASLRQYPHRHTFLKTGDVTRSRT